MKTRTLIFLISFFMVLNVNAQVTSQKATLVKSADKMITIPSIADQIANGTFKAAVNKEQEYNPKRRDANRAVPGKGLPKGNDPLWQDQSRFQQIKAKEPSLTFTAAVAYATPTDPTGAVGPNHFINAWNSAFRIWDKEGNALTSSASLATLFPGETAGDPIVFYDRYADRFVVTEFTFLNGFLIAVCQGPDPVNDGWYTYFFSSGSFPDYPKFSVWSDGYYITSNKNSGTAGYSEVVYALERDKMLVGDESAQMVGFPLPNIKTSGFYSPLGFNANGSTPPPPGNAPIVYMQDDSWSGVSTDHLKIWNINVDWENPDSSTISDPQIIETAPFDGLFDGGSFSNLPQPSGSDIDALQATIMFMAQYRRFTDHNSVVFNFVVDLDGNDDHAGIRWYELRQDNDGDPWTIYQESTYAQPDGHSAFSGNMCMDSDGNIALAYTSVSSNLYPSLRYTGRFANDPLNIMTVMEDTIANGYLHNPSYRYGDYSQMTIDPTDDKTFWSIGEYFTSSGRTDQVGVFTMAPTFQNDIGIASIDSPLVGMLSNQEAITISIRNFGVNGQANFNVSYRIDTNALVTESFSDSIQQNQTIQYTFNQTADLSEEGKIYTITAYSSLESEEFTGNDSIVVKVMSLFGNEIAVTQILSPESGTGLTESENVSISLFNNGGVDQSGFNISYVIDENEPVTEEFADTLKSLSEGEFSFHTTADFSALGEYYLTVTSELEGDANASNNSVTRMVAKTLCMPTSDCSNGMDIEGFELGTISQTSTCRNSGFTDYTSLITDLALGSSNDLVITTGHGNIFLKVWIDFNNNFVFESDEIIVDNYVIAQGEDAGTFSDTVLVEIPDSAILGEHLLRAKVNHLGGVPNDACVSTTKGETEDYKINIVASNTAQKLDKGSNRMIISNDGSNHFALKYYSEQHTEPFIVVVHNIWGQKLIQNWVNNDNGIYEYNFDMSYAAPGVYLVYLGNEKTGKVERIVVK